MKHRLVAFIASALLAVTAQATSIAQMQLAGLPGVTVRVLYPDGWNDQEYALRESISTLFENRQPGFTKGKDAVFIVRVETASPPPGTCSGYLAVVASLALEDDVLLRRDPTRSLEAFPRTTWHRSRVFLLEAREAKAETAEYILEQAELFIDHVETANRFREEQRAGAPN